MIATNKCDAPCPARGAIEVEIYGQDFRFCGHHFTKYEVALMTLEEQGKMLVSV